MSTTTMLLVTFDGLAALFVALGIPLMRRKVPPNPFYGFRTPSTLEDETLWYDVNAKSGADMVLVGVVLGVLTTTLFFTGTSEAGLATACVVWVVVGSIVLLVRGLGVVRARKKTSSSESRSGDG